MSTRAISQSPSGRCLIQSMMMPWVNMALPAPTRTIFCFGGFALSPVTGTYPEPGTGRRPAALAARPPRGTAAAAVTRLCIAVRLSMVSSLGVRPRGIFAPGTSDSNTGSGVRS